MPWNGRRFLRATIDVDGVIATFAQEFTTVILMSFVCPRISPKGSILVLSTQALLLNLVFKIVESDHAASSGRERFTQNISTAQ